MIEKYFSFQIFENEKKFVDCFKQTIFYFNAYFVHGEKWFDKFYSTFEQSWDIWANWALFNISN